MREKANRQRGREARSKGQKKQLSAILFVKKKCFMIYTLCLSAYLPLCLKSS